MVCRNGEYKVTRSELLTHVERRMWQRTAHQVSPQMHDIAHYNSVSQFLINIMIYNYMWEEIIKEGEIDDWY